MARRGGVVSNKLPALKGEMQATASQITRKTLFDVAGRIQDTVPVDTGNYRNSWVVGTTDNVFEMKPGDTEGVVGSAIEYGPFLEYGTRSMAARPNVTAAAEAYRKPYFEAMHHLIRGA